MKKHPLQHFNERKSKIDTIVLHCSIYNSEDMISALDSQKLSSHYIIGFDGEITQLVDENNRAWHAGVSFWRGTEDINSCSIGIEISNRTLGQTPYNEEQIEKLIHFLNKLIKKYNIKPQNIVAHSDIAPTRKPDPGISFPWKRLARAGIGLWYEPKHADKVTENDPVKLLASIGYDTRTEEAIIASSYAFRRRFLPEEVAIDEDISHLVNNVYPIGDQSLLQGEKFIKTLKAVVYKYDNLSKAPCNI